MKICIVHFPINDAGGIHSWGENIVYGLRKLGHEVDFVHSSLASRMKCSPEKKSHTSRYSVLPGRFISYRNPQDLLNHFEAFDLVIFLHPCPHPTKNVYEDPDGENWMELYLTKTPTLAVFHDERWDKNNEWVLNIQDDVDYVMAAQHRFLSKLTIFAEGTKLDPFWEYFPLQPYRRHHNLLWEHYIIVPTAWTKNKNHREFLSKLEDIERPVHFYGSGVEYSYMKKEGLIDSCIDFDFYSDPDMIIDAGSSPNESTFFGFRPYEEVMEAMSRAACSVDLSTAGMTNMTHWEPMQVGTVSFVHENVVMDPYCEIPLEFCIPFDNESLVEELNDFRPHEHEDMVEAAKSFVEDKCNADSVAKRILERIFP